MKKLLLLLFYCGLLGPAIAQLPLKFDLGGQWEFRKAGTTKWFPAKVPGCIQLDLMRNRIIKDPYYRLNEDSLQWIGESGWEYRRIFYMDESVFASQHIDLVLEGLDTYANVYLNDSLIVTANNMFREWYYENAKYKLIIGKNELRIQFPSIVKTNKELYSKLDKKLPGDEKVVCRKAAYNFGWDWGPKMITSGIWKPVYLKLYKKVNLLGVQFIQKKLTDTAATMSGIFTITSTVTDTASIRIDIDSVRFVNYPTTIKKGINVIRFDFVIKDPKFWWPNGLGTAYLYPLNYYVYLVKELADKGQQKIGLRTIELIQQRDTVGRTFLFLVNNVPVFIKGANYIPQDNFPTRVSDSAYRNLLTDMKGLNMNMVRVWGGGIYENDIFYDLCDELGLMVWQDFMFACAMYPRDMDFMQNVNAESIQNIVRLRRHPCIALWCGNNEIDEGWKNWGWQKQYNYTAADSASVYQGYKNLFNGLLMNNVRKFDTLRTYIPTSPMFGWGKPESRRAGDLHYWGVWWGKHPFSSYKTNVGRFMSEYGFQAFPDMSTLRRFTRPEDLQLGSAVMKAHQKHPTGYEIIDEYMMREFKRPKDFESYAYVSQILQAEGIKTAIESHRRAMPYCMGTLFWQYNDCWPVVSWSARDYFGTPKALHYYLRNEYRDVLVSPVMENGRLRVYVVTDRYYAMTGHLNVKVTDLNGKVLRDTLNEISVPYLNSKYFFDADSAAFLKGLDPKNIVMKATFITSAKIEERFSNTFYFVPLKDLALEKPNIVKEIKEIPVGFKITLTSDKLAKSVFLSTMVSGKFIENFVDIIPGEPVEIFFVTKYTGKDLLDKISIRSLQDTY